MKLEVLLSCMYQTDTSIIKRSNIQSDVLVINQCDIDKVDEFVFYNKKGHKCKARFISTSERGLSRSRNMAIRNASGDICLICDDDEYFEDDYEDKIIKVFEENSKLDVAAFKLVFASNAYVKKKFWPNPLKINYKTALKISSVQIAFKLDSIKSKKIHFDENIGSGVTKAGGEEKIFLHNCLAKSLMIVYHPICIGTVAFETSQWSQFIFTKEYFEDWGYFARKLRGGRLFAIVAGWYFLIRKYSDYCDKISFFSALKSLYSGILIKK